jgi:hypothetical protein
MSSVASKILRSAAWLARRSVSTRFIAVMSLIIEITHGSPFTSMAEAEIR